MTPPAPPDASGRAAPDWRHDERVRMGARRRHVNGIDAPEPPALESGVGLALSGGGIRSATFSLGFMQGMAQCRRGGGRVDAPAHAADPRPDHPDAPGGLLRHIDYLSTVSGGGYAGGFFCSLFVPQRARGPQPEAPEGPCVEEADDAFRALSAVPGARSIARVRPDDSPTQQRDKLIAAPLAWLRQNGRFLAPGGAGDFLYAVVLALRNLLAVHVVLGSLCFALFLALGLLRVVAVAWPPTRDAALTVETLFVGDGAGLWWSPLWLLPGGVVAVATAPLGVAYWATQHGTAATGAPWWQRSALMGIGLRVAAATVFAALAVTAPHRGLAAVAAAFGAASGASVAWYFGAKFAAFGSAAGMREDPAARIASIRLRLTLWMTASARVALVLGVIALVDTAGQALYATIRGEFSLAKAAAGGGATGLLITAIRALAARVGRDNVLKGVGALSIDRLGLLLGGALLLLVATGWSILAQTALWGAGRSPAAQGWTGRIDLCLFGADCPIDIGAMPAAGFTAPLPWAAAWLAVIAVGIGVMGRTMAFVNLSSLQQLYQSRLARAYFGASNSARFGIGTASASVLDAHPNDTIAPDGYHAPDVLAPQHL
ncbi:MAG: hypothetical protein MUF30_00565, partial [Burkholderiales bacterium]|nr:hypothetical protein [Burkholderiales bacterium]